MKLIIDIDEKIYGDLRNRGLTGMLTSKECECMSEAIYNGTPFEFGNISDEAIKESSHCSTCVHYVQRDVPNVFCEKCVNKDELYRRIENGVLEQIAEEQKTLLESTKAWSNYIDKNGNIY